MTHSTTHLTHFDLVNDPFNAFWRILDAINDAFDAFYYAFDAFKDALALLCVYIKFVLIVTNPPALRLNLHN